MYHFYQVTFVLLILLCMIGLYACIRHKKKYNYVHIAIICIATILPYLSYVIFNPLYDGPAFTALSVNRDPIQGDTVRNWGDTIECKPKYIYEPKTVEEVQNIVKNSYKVRVVGGGHSFSPLVCTNETLLTMRHLNQVLYTNETTVTVQAGSTIQDLNLYLNDISRIVHGFGSIQDQTLAGAFSTSHHGLTFHSFAEDVVGITAVLANGTVFETSDLYYWRSHLGLLGVITSMTINTYPNSKVKVSKHKVTLDEAIQMLPTADAGIIETNYNQREQALLKHITILGPESSVFTIRDYSFVSAMWDSVLVPVTVLFPSLTKFPLLDIADTDEEEDLMVQAWGKYPEYGMMYSAFAIPFQNCSAFIRSIDAKNHAVSTLLVRYLNAQQNTTCMTFAKENSCVVDVYDLQSQSSLQQFHLDLEQTVLQYGGTSHWGKYYVGDMKHQIQNMPCYNSFKSYRDIMDPEQKFVNYYAAEILELEPSVRYKISGYDTKRMVFIAVLLVSVTTIISMLVIASLPGREERFK